MEIFDYYVLFPNHQEGLRLHRKLKEAQVKCTISPTPREASSFCGISLMVSEENVAAVQKVIAESDIKIEGLVRLQRKTAVWNKTC